MKSVPITTNVSLKKNQYLPVYLLKDSFITHQESERVMVFHGIFNNISAISRNQSTRENHQPVPSHGQTLSHNVLSSIPHKDIGKSQ
jgi:hypothetical protein